MLRPGFVPPKPIQKLRDLTRYRAALVAEGSAEKNRVEKLLEDAQIKLSVVATDGFAISGRAMMAALIAGQRDPTTLAQMVRTRMRAKIPQLEEALVGHFKDHHAFLLAQRSTSMCGRPCSQCGFPFAGFRRLERGALSDECAGRRRYDAPDARVHAGERLYR